jgi:hypothetical protein
MGVEDLYIKKYFRDIFRIYGKIKLLSSSPSFSSLSETDADK